MHKPEINASVYLPNSWGTYAKSHCQPETVLIFPMSQNTRGKKNTFAQYSTTHLDGFWDRFLYPKTYSEYFLPNAFFISSRLGFCISFVF